MNDVKTFSKTLKRVREASGLSATELASKSGITRMSIWQFENGKREPRLTSLIKLANALKISIDELTGKVNLCGMIATHKRKCIELEIDHENKIKGIIEVLKQARDRMARHDGCSRYSVEDAVIIHQIDNLTK